MFAFHKNSRHFVSFRVFFNSTLIWKIQETTKNNKNEKVNYLNHFEKYRIFQNNCPYFGKEIFRNLVAPYPKAFFRSKRKKIPSFMPFYQLDPIIGVPHRLLRGIGQKK